MKEIRPLVSIIVPCYNVGKYLNECLDSLLRQTLKNIEIIALNDGSVDNTQQILDDYKTRDSRVRTYFHHNMGLGMTRNRGITLARGEYLAFVDSDDYVEETMYETLYNIATDENSDIVQCGTIMFYPDGRKNLRKDLSIIKTVDLNESTKAHFYKNYYFSKTYSHNACDKIFRRKLIIDNSIKFGDNRRIFAEDNWFQLQILLQNPRISFTSKTSYMYRQHNDSIMHKRKPNLIFRHNLMIEDYLLALSKKDNVNIEKMCCSIIAADVLIMHILDFMELKLSFREYFKDVQKVRQCKTLINSIENITKIKGYSLEPRKSRAFFLCMISICYRFKLFYLSYLIIWIFYKGRYLIK